MMLVQLSSSVFEHIERVGLIPAVRTEDSEAAVRTALAILQGGISIIEVSLAPPNGMETLRSIVRELGSDMLIGAGTVLNAEMVREAHQAGSQFVVSNGFDAGSVQAAVECGIPMYPGAMTPTEVQYAIAIGCKVVKLFPCYAVKGPAYVKTLHGQFPSIELIASGGVSLENCAEYIHAGACAVGVGGAIADPEGISMGEFPLFRERAKRFRKAIVQAQARWRPERTLAEA